MPNDLKESLGKMSLMQLLTIISLSSKNGDAYLKQIVHPMNVMEKEDVKAHLRKRANIYLKLFNMAEDELAQRVTEATAPEKAEASEGDEPEGN